MAKKKRVNCILCPEPLKAYKGRGSRSKYCDSCATIQQKKNTKIAKQIRIIKGRMNVLGDKIRQGDDKAIKKLYFELKKIEIKKKEQEIQKLKIKKGKITSKEKEMKIKFKRNEVRELMIKELGYKSKREKAENELETLLKKH
jgi:hypothetical protein